MTTSLPEQGGLPPEDRARSSMHEYAGMLAAAEHYSRQQLQKRWRLSSHRTTVILRQLLHAGLLHVVSTQPLEYSLTRPDVPPELHGDWQTYYEQVSEPLRYPELLSRWQVSEMIGKHLIAHYLNMGYLTRPKHAVYAPAHFQAAQESQLPSRPLSEAQLQLQRQRLAAVPWPARRPQILAAWGVKTITADRYLAVLEARGNLKRHRGIYYLPHQPRPDPCDYPARPPKASPPPKPPRPPAPNRYKQRLEQLTWPATISQASAAWNIPYEAAAQVLSRLTRKGLLKRIAEGHYTHV